MLKDTIAAVTLLGVAISYYFGVNAIADSALGDEVGARGLPLVYASVLAVLAVALLGRALLRGRLLVAPRAEGDAGRAGAAASSGTRPTHARAAGMFAIGIGYIALVPYLGYFVTLVIVLATVAWYQGERDGLRLAVTSVLGAAFFLALFAWVLGVDTPSGIWAGMLQ